MEGLLSMSEVPGLIPSAIQLKIKLCGFTTFSLRPQMIQVPGLLGGFTEINHMKLSADLLNTVKAHPSSVLHLREQRA